MILPYNVYTSKILQILTLLELYFYNILNDQDEIVARIEWEVIYQAETALMKVQNDVLSTLDQKDSGVVLIMFDLQTLF